MRVENQLKKIKIGFFLLMLCFSFPAFLIPCEEVDLSDYATIELVEGLEENCTLCHIAFLELNSSFYILNSSYLTTVNNLLNTNSSLNDLTILYNELQLNYTNLQNEFDELEENCSATQEMLSELGNLTDIISNLYNSIDNLTDYYIDISNNYSILLADFTDLYNNFTSYVELLESFENITALIQDINADILIEHNRISTLNSSLITLTNNYNNLTSSFWVLHSEMHVIQAWKTSISADLVTVKDDIVTLKSNITSIDTRLDTLEAYPHVYTPAMESGMAGFTDLTSDLYGAYFYVLHADTNAYMIYNFAISGPTGNYRVIIFSWTSVNTRTSSGKLYVGQFTDGSSAGWNKVNGGNMDLDNALTGNLYRETYSANINLSYFQYGSLVTVKWLKDNDAGSGYLYIYACYLVRV